MAKKETPSVQAADFRKRAEKIALETLEQLPENIDGQSPEEIRQTLHELRVHQIELDMQNEELRRSRVELEDARARYFDLYDMAPVGYLTVSEKGMILEANLTAANLLGVAKKSLILQLLTRFIIKEDQEIYYRHRKMLVETHSTLRPSSVQADQEGQAGASQSWEMRMLKKDGTPFWAHLEATTAQDFSTDSASTLRPGSVRANIGQAGASELRITLNDITEHKRVEEIRILSDRLSQVFNSLDALIYVIDMKTYEVLFVNTYGQNIWGDVKGKICWQTIQAGQTGPCAFCTNNKLIGSDSRPTDGVVWEFQNTVDKRWYNCRDRAIYWPDGRIVRMEIATDITERKAMMVELESSCQQLRVLNRRWVEIEELERKRLSAELHDEIGQNMTALGINFGILKMSLPPATDSRVYDRINDSIDLLKKSSVHMKGIMSNLRPALLDDYGLVPALHWYAQESAKRTGIKISCDAGELSFRPAAEIETALFRIAQEAVNNSVKHARAKRIRLSLKHAENKLSLVIADNGTGFSMRVIPGQDSHGWGLMIIKERCFGIKGICHIESKPGGGTKISIEVPL